MLSQVKHQHWIDEMAWPDTRTCIAYIPLLFILFQDLPNYLLAEFWNKFQVTSGTSTVPGVDVGRMLPFGSKTGYGYITGCISCAYEWRYSEWSILAKTYAFFLFNSQNTITDQGQTFRKAFLKGQYYFLGPEAKNTVLKNQYAFRTHLNCFLLCFSISSLAHLYTEARWRVFRAPVSPSLMCSCIMSWDWPPRCPWRPQLLMGSLYPSIKSESKWVFTAQSITPQKSQYKSWRGVLYWDLGAKERLGATSHMLRNIKKRSCMGAC